MSCHVSRIKTILYRKTDEILANLKSELKHPDGNLIDIRECEVRLGDHRFVMLRCFVNAKDSGVFVNVGWVINDNMDQCLLCRSFFGFFNRKHHCRACGTLVCRSCSPHNAHIITMEQYGMMKVCKECYRGQGEPVPVLNTRHLGRSLKPVSKSDTASTAPSTANASPLSATDNNINNNNNKKITVPSTTVSSPMPPSPSNDSNNNKSNNTTANSNKSGRDRAESDSYLTPPPYLAEFPLPGYVVKTRRYATSEKVFINICHHPSILDPMMSLFNVVLPPDEVTLQEEEARKRMNSEYRDITAASSLDSTIVPIIYLNEQVDATQDKVGESSVLYWVMISSEYFKTSTLKYTSVAVVQKVMEAINKTFKDSLLEDEYVRPRVKGGMKVGVATCHPISNNNIPTVADGVSSFPFCPVTFIAPIRFVLNTTDVALLLRILPKSTTDNLRSSFTDSRSVYTERTAGDLDLARDEDDKEQRNTFSLFFNPLPSFPRFQNKRTSTTSSANTFNNNADTYSEVSDLTFVSYNPRLPSGQMAGKLPKSSNQLPASPKLSKSRSAIVQSTTSNQHTINRGMSSSASVTDSVSNEHNNKRFGWLAAANDTKFGPNGRDLLTASMLVYHKDNSLSDKEVLQMMEQSAKLPAVLMGWQIKLEIPRMDDDENNNVQDSAHSLNALSSANNLNNVSSSSLNTATTTWMIFVITGIRKNSMRKTEFRISSLLREDQWILLKRSNNKLGYDFRPLRQVLSFPK